MAQFPLFRDGHLNREPKPKPEIKQFKHGKGYGYNPKIEKSPLQRVEAKRER